MIASVGSGLRQETGKVQGCNHYDEGVPVRRPEPSVVIREGDGAASVGVATRHDVRLDA